MDPDSYEGKVVAEIDSVIRELEQVFAEGLVDAGDNYQAMDMQKKTIKDGASFSNREYGGIRESLAKKGLDELSERYGSRFPLSASFDSAIREDKTKLIMETVSANSVRALPRFCRYATQQKRELQQEAAKIRNAITIIDKQLFRLEATKPLQNVLNTERNRVPKEHDIKQKSGIPAGMPDTFIY